MLDWTAIWPFFCYQSINRRLSVASRCAEVLKTKNISQRLRLRRLSKIWVVSWQLTWEDVTKFTSSSVNANGKTSILLKFFFRYGFSICQCHCQSSWRRDDDSSIKKKKIYEVKVKTYFVLKPRIEIKNWILVSYLNSIYNLFLQARTSNYLAQNPFLIANVVFKKTKIFLTVEWGKQYALVSIVDDKCP